MSPRKLSAGQRISCHFLEADHAEDVAHDGHQPDGLRWLALPLPGSGATGADGASAGLAGGVAAAASPSRACGLVFCAAAPPDRAAAAVIPPMKRRLITLSTAGNLKISPLSNQQLHPQRIYPVRRPSDFDGAAAAAFVAAPDGAAAGGGGGGGGWLQHLHAQMPPPPPGTPARHSQPPSSHPFLERQELSPREDNVQQDGDFRCRRSSSPEPPPLPPATPRGGGWHAGGGGGGGGGSGFTTPRLVLRPVRPLHDRSLADGGCSAVSGAAVVVEAPVFAGAWPENLTPVHGGGVQQKPSPLLPLQQQQQQQQQEPHLAGLEATGVLPRQHSMGAGGARGTTGTGVAAGGFDAPMHIESGTPGQHRMEAVATATTASGGVPRACGASRPAAAVAAADPDVEYMEDALAAATAAAEAAGGLAWASVEVTVAVRPKASATRRLPYARVGIDGGGMTEEEEVHNGYVRGPACGTFDLMRYLTGRDCVRQGGRWVSRSQFEKVGGSTMAKWYRSIRVLPDLEPLGEWLERHGMPVLRGPARRSRKRSATAADSGDELGGGYGGWDAADGGRAGAAMLPPWSADIATAAAGVDGAARAAAPETWANRMLMAHPGGVRGGSGGDDLLVQRLLSTWPLSQPFMRPPTAAAATAAATQSTAAGMHGIGARAHHHPPAAQVVAEAGILSGVAAGDTDAAMLASVPEIKCALPTRPSSIVSPRSGDQATALHSQSAPQGAGDSSAAPPLRRQQCEPAGCPAPPPRPRLLLHRTGAAALGDGRGGSQPYLFAVHAPSAMLFRGGGGGVASPTPSGAVRVEANGPQAMEE